MITNTKLLNMSVREQRHGFTVYSTVSLNQVGPSWYLLLRVASFHLLLCFIYLQNKVYIATAALQLMKVNT